MSNYYTSGEAMAIFAHDLTTDPEFREHIRQELFTIMIETGLDMIEATEGTADEKLLGSAINYALF